MWIECDGTIVNLNSVDYFHKIHSCICIRFYSQSMEWDRTFKIFQERDEFFEALCQKLDVLQ